MNRDLKIWPFDCSESEYGYRGMMLDVARHALPVENLHKFVELLAQLGFNRLHLHLTDDQGWRWEVKKYPLLHKIGSKRKSSQQLPHRPNSQDGVPYQHFYTQEELKGLVNFALKMGIEIVPEIDLPGHSVAAISAYPWLAGLTESPEVKTEWGVFEPILLPSDEVVQFYRDVLDELLEIFPSRYIHLGGDEAPKKGWKESTFVQNRILELGLKDEEEMQSWFMNELGKHLKSRNRELIGWDEILDGNPAPETIVMCWRGLDKAREALNRGYSVVVTPTSHTYFDYYQTIFKENEPTAIGGYLPWEKVLEFASELAKLRAEFGEKVMGAQVQLWSEYLFTTDQFEFMALPRLFVFSECFCSNPRSESQMRMALKEAENLPEASKWNMRKIDESLFHDYSLLGTWDVDECSTLGKNFSFEIPEQFINQMVEIRVQYTAGAHYVKISEFETESTDGVIFNQMVNGMTGAIDSETVFQIPAKTRQVSFLLSGVNGSDNTGLFLISSTAGET